MKITFLRISLNKVNRYLEQDKLNVMKYGKKGMVSGHTQVVGLATKLWTIN
jgi:hypothetical protein